MRFEEIIAVVVLTVVIGGLQALTSVMVGPSERNDFRLEHAAMIFAWLPEAYDWPVSWGFSTR